MVMKRKFGIPARRACVHGLQFEFEIYLRWPSDDFGIAFRLAPTPRSARSRHLRSRYAPAAIISGYPDRDLRHRTVFLSKLRMLRCAIGDRRICSPFAIRFHFPVPPFSVFKKGHRQDNRVSRSNPNRRTIFITSLRRTTCWRVFEIRLYKWRISARKFRQRFPCYQCSAVVLQESNRVAAEFLFSASVIESGWVNR